MPGRFLSQLSREGAARPTWHRGLVTGASSGIGRAFAVALAAAGTDVIAVARRQDRLQALAAEVRRAHGREVEVLVADLSDQAQLRSVEERLADSDSPVDVLVNCAGFGTFGRFADLSLEQEEHELRVNVFAPVRLTHVALGGMIERGRGGIINVSSIAAVQPLPRWATYGATKAYLTSFSQAVHEEVRDRGVTVLALMPGFTRTEFQDRSGSATSGLPGFVWMSPEAVARSGLSALARGRATHVPGLGYRAFAAVSRITPWAFARRVVHKAGHRL